VAVTTKRRVEPAPSSFNLVRFLREVYDELRKVVWPTWNELYRYTLVVIVTVIVIGGFIGGVDYILSQLSQKFIYSGVAH
jgi:preprotein translocase subunit SecE